MSKSKKLCMVIPCFVVFILLVMFFGNAQSSRWIYVFHAHVLRTTGKQHPPKGYTGVWRTWHSNGSINTEINFKDGRKHGLYSFWKRSGLLLESAEYARGELHGIRTIWHEGTHPWLFGYYYFGEPVVIQYFKAGHLTYIEKYKDNNIYETEHHRDGVLIKKVPDLHKKNADL